MLRIKLIKEYIVENGDTSTEEVALNLSKFISENTLINEIKSSGDLSEVFEQTEITDLSSDDEEENLFCRNCGDPITKMELEDNQGLCDGCKDLGDPEEIQY